MIMNWKMHNSNALQSDPEIQCNPCQNLKWLFCRFGQTDFKIHEQMQGIQNNKTVLEEGDKEQSRRTHTTLFQNLLQSKNSQNIVTQE